MFLIIIDFGTLIINLLYFVGFSVLNEHVESLEAVLEGLRVRAWLQGLEGFNQVECLHQVLLQVAHQRVPVLQTWAFLVLVALVNRLDDVLLLSQLVVKLGQEVELIDESLVLLGQFVGRIRELDLHPLLGLHLQNLDVRLDDLLDLELN